MRKSTILAMVIEKYKNRGTLSGGSEVVLKAILLVERNAFSKIYHLINHGSIR